jgi:hypothetical protein
MVNQFAAVLETTLVPSVTDGDSPVMRALVLMVYALQLRATRLLVLAIPVFKVHFVTNESTSAYQNPAV